MRQPQRHPGGRRSKGDRRQIISRMPVATADKLESVAKATSSSISDYVAELVAEHLKTISLDALSKDQEALPFEQAS